MINRSISSVVVRCVVLAAETTWQRYRVALTNGRLLLAGLAIGFQNTVRYGLLIWVPVYFPIVTQLAWRFGTLSRTIRAIATVRR